MPNGANVPINEFLTKQCYPNVPLCPSVDVPCVSFTPQMPPMLQVSLGSLASSSSLEYLRSR